MQCSLPQIRHSKDWKEQYHHYKNSNKSNSRPAIAYGCRCFIYVKSYVSSHDLGCFSLENTSKEERHRIKDGRASKGPVRLSSGVTRTFFFRGLPSFRASNNKKRWSKSLQGSFWDLKWAETTQNQDYKVILIFDGVTKKLVRIFSVQAYCYTSISA